MNILAAFSIMLVATAMVPSDATGSTRCGPYYPDQGCLNTQCCNEYSACYFKDPSISSCPVVPYLLPFLVTSDGVFERCGSTFGELTCAPGFCCTPEGGCGAADIYCPSTSPEANQTQSEQKRCGTFFSGFECGDDECCNQYSYCEALPETSDACLPVEPLVPYIITQTGVFDQCGPSFGDAICAEGFCCNASDLCTEEACE